MTKRRIEKWFGWKKKPLIIISMAIVSFLASDSHSKLASDSRCVQFKNLFHTIRKSTRDDRRINNFIGSIRCICIMNRRNLTHRNVYKICVNGAEMSVSVQKHTYTYSFKSRPKTHNHMHIRTHKTYVTIPVSQNCKKNIHRSYNIRYLHFVCSHSLFHNNFQCGAVRRLCCDVTH